MTKSFGKTGAFFVSINCVDCLQAIAVVPDTVDLVCRHVHQ